MQDRGAIISSAKSQRDHFIIGSFLRGICAARG
jgi:hypothetical protein